MNLPPALLQDCRDVLLSCDEFENLQSLKAVFITDELCALKYRLPINATNQAELVDFFLKYILEQQIKGGKPAFPVFLATLQEKYTDDRANHLRQLLEDIQAQQLSVRKSWSLSPEDQHKLQEKLLTLDFRLQVQQVKEVIEQNRIAAFLVHGPPAHGQRVLTHRLSHLRTAWDTGRRIVVDAGSNGIGLSSDSLWRQVAKQLDMPFDTDKKILAEKICEWWKTQDVIFVFYTVDYIPEDLLCAWLDNFWKPITEVAQRKEQLTLLETHLLLFLVDFRGHVCQTKLTLLDQPGQISSSYAPLKLPPASRFNEIVLEGLIENAAELLPSSVSVTQLINSTDNGIPERVYMKVCEYCGLAWEGDMVP